MSHRSESAVKGAESCDQPVPTRLVIFGARRTGSSFLVRTLRAHPQVLMHGELYHVTNIHDPADGWAPGVHVTPPSQRVFDHRRMNPLPMLQHVQCRAGGRRVVGLKVFRDHLRPENWPVLTQWCDVCVILRRRDTLAQYRSLIVARRTGNWKAHSDARNASVARSDANYRAWLRNQEKWYRSLSKQLVARQPTPAVVELTLEDHIRPFRGEYPEFDVLWKALQLSAAPSPADGRLGGSKQ